MNRQLLFCFFILGALIVRNAQGQGTAIPKTFSIEKADTLYFAGYWDQARSAYESAVNKHPDQVKALTWNRLGYCYHNLGKYKDAIRYYEKAILAGAPAPLKPFLDSRLARAYSRIPDREKAFIWLDSAVKNGYSLLRELDTLRDFDAIRTDSRFHAVREKVRAVAFPCTNNPHNRAFDFWVGDWDVFQTGTTTPVIGHSVVERASGGCMILENWTALVGSHEGKSINYYSPVTGLWEQDWIGSDGNPVKFTNGEYKDGAMRFIFEARQRDGTVWPGRFIFYNESPDRVRQFSEQSPDGGKTWQTNYDYTYLRKK